MNYPPLLFSIKRLLLLFRKVVIKLGQMEVIRLDYPCHGKIHRKI